MRRATERFLRVLRTYITDMVEGFDRGLSARTLRQQFAAAGIAPRKGKHGYELPALEKLYVALASAVEARKTRVHISKLQRAILDAARGGVVYQELPLRLATRGRKRPGRSAISRAKSKLAGRGLVALTEMAGGYCTFVTTTPEGETLLSDNVSR